MCYMQYDDMDLLKTTIDMAASIICDSVKKMIEIPKVAGVFIATIWALERQLCFLQIF